LRRPLELGLPPQKRLSRAALALSAALHLVLFATLSVSGRPPSGPLVPRPAIQVIDLTPPSPEAPVVRPPALPPAMATRPAPARGTPAAGPAEDAVVAGAPGPVAPAAVDTASGAPESASRIGPGLARGKLWVRPLPLPPRELAQRLARSHSELADSAVTAIVQAFLDSVALDPASRGVTMPSWTTTIAGSKFGLDSKYIYIAGLRIPAAVLALLPIPAAGNELKAFDRSGELYEDMRRAAQRSANTAEFKDAIREIRERVDREREFERNQRTPPPGRERETPDQ